MANQKCPQCGKDASTGTGGACLWNRKVYWPRKLPRKFRNHDNRKFHPAPSGCLKGTKP